MRRRLLFSTALIALAAVIVLGVPLGILAAHRVRADATSNLEREADGVAAAIDDRLEAHRPLERASLRSLVRPGHLITVVTRSGRRVSFGTPSASAKISARSAAARATRVTASEPASEVTGPVHRVWGLVALLSAGGVLAAVGLAFLQARRLGRPLEDLARTARELGTGDFSARAGHSALPEIDAVGVALDASAARVADLVAREREFSANVSHQLRTPLTALRLRLEELAALQHTDAGAEEAQSALGEADRLERTINELLAAARGHTAEVERIELGDLARVRLARWRPVYARAGRALSLRTSEPVAAMAARAAVGQALDVLLDNALVHGRGHVHIEVTRPDGRPMLAVRDEGEGIPAGMEAAVFDRGSSLGGGSGLGLHIARALIESIGGSLRLERTPPTSFRIDLIADPAERRPHGAVSGGRRRLSQPAKRK